VNESRRPPQNVFTVSSVLCRLYPCKEVGWRSLLRQLLTGRIPIQYDASFFTHVFNCFRRAQFPLRMKFSTPLPFSSFLLLIVPILTFTWSIGHPPFLRIYKNLCFFNSISLDVILPFLLLYRVSAGSPAFDPVSFSLFFTCCRSCVLVLRKSGIVGISHERDSTFQLTFQLPSLFC